MKKEDVEAALRNIADPEIAEHSQRFFKTGKREYAEGDQFLGIRVPNIRKVARRFKQLSLAEIEKLLHSNFHEERLCALIMMANRAKKAGPEEQKRLYDLYLRNADYINNWDLVIPPPSMLWGVTCLVMTGPFFTNWLNLITYGNDGSPS